MILGCFSLCWLPYFIVACAQIFKFLENSSPTIYKAAFSLAMANSGMNPIIYAWKNTNFRRAFGRLLKCKAPDSVDPIQNSMRSNLHRKSSSLHHQDTINGSLPNYSTPPPFQKVTPPVAIAPSTINTKSSYMINNEEENTTQFQPKNVSLAPEPQNNITICVNNDNGNLSIVINDDDYESTSTDCNNDNDNNGSKSLFTQNYDRKNTFDNENVSGGYDFNDDDNNDRVDNRKTNTNTTNLNYQGSKKTQRRCILKSTSNSEIIPIPPPPPAIKKSSSQNSSKNNNKKSTTNINNNEITMTNIIINKCAIIENFENMKNSEHIFTGTKYNLSDTENSGNGGIACFQTPSIIPAVMRENKNYQKPNECATDSSNNKNDHHEFVYKINLINEK